MLLRLINQLLGTHPKPERLPIDSADRPTLHLERSRALKPDVRETVQPAAAAKAAAYVTLLETMVINRDNSTAQLFQDLFALHMSGFKKNGYFVEFGATNGLSLSNTYVMEKQFGWNGIVAEPLPSWHAELEKNRSCHIDKRCVYSASNLTMAFVDTFEYPELSGLQQNLPDDANRPERVNHRTFEVQTVALMDLLAHYGAPRQIDYLSIDTEGSELEILRAFDFSRYEISVITVEHNYMEPHRSAIRALLEGSGYVGVCRDISRHDDWYVQRDNSVLPGLLSG